MTQALQDFLPEFGTKLKLGESRSILMNDGGGVGDGVVFKVLVEPALSRAGIEVDDLPACGACARLETQGHTKSNKSIL